MAENTVQDAVAVGEERLKSIASGTTPGKSMSATMVSMTEGAKSFEDVRVIRLKDKRLTLLIMCDYMPLICELSNGSVEFVAGEKIYRYENMSGYVSHRDNVFTFLVKEDSDV